MMRPEIAAEIDNFEAEVGRFLRGELGEERFRAFRLAHGIYGQRQPGVQMVRVKIPAGMIDGRQLALLADIAQTYASGVAHLTTRQDVQFHFVKLADVPKAMRTLAEGGLTTREACGNSVRNVTACPLAGYIAEEVFDVRPHALAISGFLLRNPFCQQLARKFKIALSACPEDCAAVAIHDIGLLGRVEGEGSERRIGFKVLVGGGLGAAPFMAKALSEFVEESDLLPTVKAVLEVASALGNRRNKMRARLKFVVHKVGIETFRELVARELADLTPEELAEADLRSYRRESPSVPPPDGAPPPAEGGVPDPRFDRWSTCSVRAHRIPERAVVTVMIPLGDIEAPKLRALAGLVSAHGGDHARIAVDQNLVLPDVPRGDLRALHEGLRAIGLAEAGAGTALDVTCCPGADTCNLGITSSKGLTRAIRARLLPGAAGGGLEALRGVTIKVSGCPNSCGQHHIAGIGLHGVVKKIGARQAPAYQLHLGGRVGPGEARLARAAWKVAARKVPEAVAALVELFRRERSGEESFSDFIAGLPDARLEPVLRPFLGEEPAEELFVDWGQSAPYTTGDLGVGECAGAGADAASGPLDAYEAEVHQAFLFMGRGQWVDATANLNRSQYTLARALLKVLGKSPESDYETACELRAHVIDRGHAGELWNAQHAAIERLLRRRAPDPAEVQSVHRRALELLEESRATLWKLSRLKAAAAASEVPG